MKRIKLQLGVALFSAALLSSCSDNEVINYIPEPEVETYMDCLVYDELNPKSKSFVLALNEPSSVITSQRSFNLKAILRAEANANKDSILITSYSAKPITNVTLKAYLSEIDATLHLATIDSIPMFGQLAFRPAFLDEETRYATDDTRIVELKKEIIPIDMTFALDSDCAHYQMLKKIKTDWSLSFSNYDWNPDTSTSWLELSSMVAREWVVIVTNLGYMLSSPQYKEVMNNFNRIFGGELYGNTGELYTNVDYNNFIERCFQSKRFVLGRVNPAYVAGLGGGSTWGVADWNFYGHYASYSGWGAIVHELGHCYGYSHNSNFTYDSKEGVGWTNMMAYFHVYMNTLGDMPYESRDILDTHNPNYDEYRGFSIDRSKMNDAETAKMYTNSKVRKYFDNEL